MLCKLFVIYSFATVIRAQILETNGTLNTVPPNKGVMDWVSDILNLLTSTTTLRPHEDPPEDCPSCKCGTPSTSRRIVGGSETEINKYAWMVLLLYRRNFYCGGSLVNDLYVMTAAHCTTGFLKEFITVIFHEHDMSSSNETNTIERNVAEIIRHLLYNPVTYDNDIALLKLDRRINLTMSLRQPKSIVDMRNNGSEDRDGEENVPENDEDSVEVWPICMPDPDLSYTDYDAIATGWGLTEENGEPSDTLQEVHVPVLSNEECNTDYGGRITDNMVCAGVPEGGRDSCQGDSGGPLLIFNNDTVVYQQIGIVSWGKGCAEPNNPGVYTRVNRYLAWIRRNTKDACYCD